MIPSTNMSRLTARRPGLISTLLLPITRRQFHLLAKQIQQQQRSDTTAVTGTTTRGENIRSNTYSLLANHFQRLNHRDAWRAERADLFLISNALCFTHQPNFLGFRTACLQNEGRFALRFGFALFGSLSGDFDTDSCGHQVALIVSLRLGLFQLNALVFCFTLGVVHVLALLSENLLSLRLHQLLRQMNVTDEYVYDVNMIFQKMRSHPCFSALLFFMTILQIGHRRGFGCLVAKDRIDQR